MRIGIIVAALGFLAAPGPLFAAIDIFVEIGPSDKPEGYHTKIKVEKHREDRVLLTLPMIDGAPYLEAWMVVCENARKKGHRNFRYDVHWQETRANKPDIGSVIPVKFSKDGVATIQLTADQASRSYIVFGGHFDDGTFYTVNLPGFLKAMKESLSTE